jgi:outer membrane protein assembly factor BamB
VSFAQTPRHVTGAIAMFRGDATHTGVYSARTGPYLAGLQWRVETDGGVVSSPAILGDTVWIGSSDGRLYAIDLVSGGVRWKTDLGSPVMSSPAVGAGRVIVGTRDGHFHALASRSGKRLWSAATGPDTSFPWGHESGDMWTSSPVLANSLAIAGSGDGKVYAFDAASGAVRWKFATEGRVRSSPAVAAARLFVGSADGRIYALDVATGRQVWRYDTEGVSLFSGNFGYDRRTVQSSPVVWGNTVYVGARDGFLYALSADSGQLRWWYDYKISWVNASSAIADGELYAGTSDGQFVNALDAATGKELWRTGSESIVWASPSVSGDIVIAGDGLGRVRGYDRRTGAVRWSFVTGGQIFSTPVPVGQLVVFGSMDGAVYAVRTDAAPVARAVFIDSSGTVKPEPTQATLATTLNRRGYESLGAGALPQFLNARIADKRPSVVVFAMDWAPDAILGDPLERSLLRRYLDAGGKVVWTRVPPGLWPLDPKTGARGGLKTLAWDGPSKLLGVPHDRTIFDGRLVRPTDAGKRWGLTGRWRDAWAVDPRGVTEVLALDDWGLAASWVRNYGGARGTGFVRAPTDETRMIYLLAEYRPAERP